jgi:DNA-binding PucR family transcriptional regulator
MRTGGGFTFLDEIADASARGYAQARAAEAGEFDRRRRRLVTLLTASPPASAEAVTAAAGWPLRHRLARRQRDVLADTLLAWLPANGNANAVAAALHIHPQTARHRFRQLVRLFGDALHDGEAMFELRIAPRAERARRRADAG